MNRDSIFSCVLQSPQQRLGLVGWWNDTRATGCDVVICCVRTAGLISHMDTWGIPRNAGGWLWFVKCFFCVFLHSCDLPIRWFEVCISGQEMSGTWLMWKVRSFRAQAMLVWNLCSELFRRRGRKFKCIIWLCSSRHGSEACEVWAAFLGSIFCKFKDQFECVRS